MLSRRLRKQGLQEYSSRFCPHGLANKTEPDIADSKSRAVVAVSGRHTLERRGLIPAATARHRKAGWQAIEWIDELSIRSSNRRTLLRSLRSAPWCVGSRSGQSGRSPRSVGPASKWARLQCNLQLLNLPLQILDLLAQRIDLLLL